MTTLNTILVAITFIAFAINLYQLWRELYRNASERHAVNEMRTRVHTLTLMVTDCIKRADAIVLISQQANASKHEIEHHARLLRESLKAAQLDLRGQMANLDALSYLVSKKRGNQGEEPREPPAGSALQ